MAEDAPILPGLSPVGKPMHVSFDGGRLTSDTGGVNGTSDCVAAGSCCGLPPWGAGAQDGVQDDDEFAHGGGERKRLSLPAATRRWWKSWILG